jgi:CheY-like chemotaxis protein
MPARDAVNRRVLVIDDDESVRDSFATVLAPPPPASDAVAAAAAALFGDAPAGAHARRTGISFDVDLAPNGPAGAEMVARAVAAGRPYAVVFCDIRMPVWDGLETVARIRQVDRRAEVVFVTAYTDHDIDRIVERAGANVGYFVKPFSTDELRQIATKAVVDWNRARELEALVDVVSGLRGEAEDGDRLAGYVVAQV